jgi:pimeloyl-ACP methyl ester carboxylesterase
MKRILVALMLIYSIPFAAQAQLCDGLPATIVGTAGDDELQGTDGNDVIVGLDGNDRILGGSGDDVICGGAGDDDLIGEGGADQLIGGGGNDVMEGGADSDVCDGVTGIDSADLDCETTANTDAAVITVTLFADDDVQLDGALYIPVRDALSGGGIRNLAMIVSHGAMGSFASSVPKIMGMHGAPLGFTVLALNRRDWGPDSGGGAVLYEDATLDLGVGIDFLHFLGFESIYVAGHSQGTQNAGIYPSLSMDGRVAAVGLYGTVDDGRKTATEVLFAFPPTLYEDHVARANQLIADGEGEVVVPWNTLFGVDLFRTPLNFLSYWGPDTLSVVVREITKLEVPALLMRAAGDGFTPDEWSVDVTAAAVNAGVDATYIELDYPFPLSDENGGNAHGFVGVEREMIQATLDWLVSHVPEATRYTADIQIPAENPPGNFEPIAHAGDPFVDEGNTFVRLDGSQSFDIDGEIVSYFWTQVSGAEVPVVAPDSDDPLVRAPLTPQTLTFELTVTDDDGGVSTDTVEVTFTPDAVGGSSSSLDPLALLLLFLPVMIHRRRAHPRRGMAKSS